MRHIRILAALAVMVATTVFATQAVACPAGYFRCGSSCCPTR